MGIQLEIILFLSLILILGGVGFWGYHAYAVAKIDSAETKEKQYEQSLLSLQTEYQRLVKQVQDNQQVVKTVNQNNEDIVKKMTAEIAKLKQKDFVIQAVADVISAEKDVNQLSDDIFAQLKAITDPNWTQQNAQISTNSKSTVTSLLNKLHAVSSTH